MVLVALFNCLPDAVINSIMKPVILKQSFWVNEKLNMNWEEEFDKIYPLQIWNESNKEQAIFITPTLQKRHKEEVKQFIQNLLDKQEKNHQEEKIALNKMLNQDCFNQLDKQKSDIMSIVQKEVAKSDKYQIAPLERIRFEILGLNK